ncbi:ACP S-malonyltransferase [Lentilactobacillus kosonis]|uniref:Malonyl CoA-acyl carrier protein transacylase n=1 Tax=Lentilactobacillus kosonis TaxID=2810561 RepID=A0A401FLM2_9LACO|nr:ACP S-malonyltransferase [Lentilactobacillus kosonis]GAY73206.1 malonyl CoA-acyl carrier protein transacylase [Lentilactobacillus kosonis]
MKLGYLFSGQGSQFEKMGQDLYQTEPVYKQTVDEAAEILGINLSDAAIFDDPNNIQVAVLTMSTGIHRIISQDLGDPMVAAGLSLGEYSALVASKAIAFSDALQLVRDRSRYMDVAGKINPGSMAAVLNANNDLLEAALKFGNEAGRVYPANYNTSSQVVIGGDDSGVTKASSYLKQHGVKRVIPMKVAVASHTPLMTSAADQLGQRLETISFDQPVFPVISNTISDSFTQTNIKMVLKRQLVEPTHFVDGVQKMTNLGATTFVELGPGATLSKLTKKINRGVETYHVDSAATLTELRKKLG